MQTTAGETTQRRDDIDNVQLPALVRHAHYFLGRMGRSAHRKRLAAEMAKFCHDEEAIEAAIDASCRGEPGTYIVDQGMGFLHLDDLELRVREIENWKKAGQYSGWALNAFGEYIQNHELCATEEERNAIGHILHYRKTDENPMIMIAREYTMREVDRNYQPSDISIKIMQELKEGVTTTATKLLKRDQPQRSSKGDAIEQAQQNVSKSEPKNAPDQKGRTALATTAYDIYQASRRPPQRIQPTPKDSSDDHWLIRLLEKLMGL